MNRIALFLVLIASLANGQDFKATLRWMHNTASYDGGGYHGGDKTMMDGTEIPLRTPAENLLSFKRRITLLIRRSQTMFGESRWICRQSTRRKSNLIQSKVPGTRKASVGHM